MLEKNKTAIVLVPEISLTPQMVDRFLARFGEEKIAVLHSKLSRTVKDLMNGVRFKQVKPKLLLVLDLQYLRQLKI